jgi:hypothetical protein
VFRNHEGYRVIHPASVTDRFTASDDLVEFLRRQPGLFRVFPLDDPGQAVYTPAFMSNRFMAFDIASIGGYHPAKLAAYEEYLDALGASVAQWRLDLANAMNARYVVTGVRLPEHPALEAVWVGEDHEGRPRAVYENHDAFPRAWVAGAYRVASGAEALALVSGGEVDLHQTAVLEREPAVTPVAGDSAEVQVTKYTTREVVLAVELDRPGLVVLADAYYKDWRATVDGAPAELLRANHVMRAVAVPAGRHEIVMRYDTSLLRKSATVSIGAFVLTALAIVGSLVARRRGARLGETQPEGNPWKPSS